MREFVLVAGIELSALVGISVAVDDAVGGLDFSGDAEHLVSISLDVVEGVRDDDYPVDEVLLDLKFNFSSRHLLFVRR